MSYPEYGRRSVAGLSSPSALRTSGYSASSPAGRSVPEYSRTLHSPSASVSEAYLARRAAAERTRIVGSGSRYSSPSTSSTSSVSSLAPYATGSPSSRTSTFSRTSTTSRSRPSAYSPPSASSSRYRPSLTASSPATRTVGDRTPSYDALLSPTTPSSAATPPSVSGKLTSGAGLVGLDNLGNTCFLNSALQGLLNLPPLVDYFLANDASTVPTGNSRMRGSIARAFADLVGRVWAPPRRMASSARSASVRPSDFKHEVGRFAPRFTGYAQQDAQELLRFVLDGIHEDLNDAGRNKPLPYDDAAEDRLPEAEKSRAAWERYLHRNRSVVVDTFAGQLVSRVECSTCGHVSTCYDPFLDISLPIPADGRRSLSSCTLDDCLREFTKDEVLSRRDQYRCARCKEPRDAVKQLAFHRLPSVLVVHLKRFSQSSFSRTKINTAVDFPRTRLSFDAFLGPDAPASGATYHLVAVTNHMGSLSGGHYTATVLNRTSNKWYEMNDSRVHETSSPRASSSPYILFFVRDG